MVEYIGIGILVIIISVLLLTLWAYSEEKELGDPKKYVLCAYAEKDPGKTIENYQGKWIDEDNDDIDLDEYEQFIVVGRRYIRFNIKDGDSLFCDMIKIDKIKNNEFYIIDRGNKFNLRLGREIDESEIKDIIARVIYLSKKK